MVIFKSVVALQSQKYVIRHFPNVQIVMHNIKKHHIYIGIKKKLLRS